MTNIAFQTLASQLFFGGFGWLVFYGLVVANYKIEPTEKKFKRKTKEFDKKYKRLFGHCQLLEGSNGFLQRTLEREQAKLKEAQRVRDKLNDELARCEKKLRSREFELDEERSKKRKRRHR